MNETPLHVVVAKVRHSRQTRRGVADIVEVGNFGRFKCAVSVDRNLPASEIEAECRRQIARMKEFAHG